MNSNQKREGLAPSHLETAAEPLGLPDTLQISFEAAEINAATGRRIIAAYNATAGIAVDELETDCVAELIDAAAAMLDAQLMPIGPTMKARQRLAAALTRCMPAG